jgi:hypothetical protein
MSAEEYSSLIDSLDEYITACREYLGRHAEAVLVGMAEDRQCKDSIVSCRPSAYGQIVRQGSKILELEVKSGNRRSAEAFTRSHQKA